MKLPAGTEKWASAALGVVSLALLVNLVVQFRGTRKKGSHPRPAVRTAVRGPAAKAADDLARYDPVLHLDKLKELDGRPLPALDRNLFDFEAPPPPPVVAAQPVVAQAAAPPPPPPPPPITLKPVGYNEMPGGLKQVVVTQGDRPEDPTFIVHEGEVVLARYKILKITPTVLTVEDAIAHRTADLPIPQ